MPAPHLPHEHRIHPGHSNHHHLELQGGHRGGIFLPSDRSLSLSGMILVEMGKNDNYSPLGKEAFVEFFHGLPLPGAIDLDFRSGRYQLRKLICIVCMGQVRIKSDISDKLLSCWCVVVVWRRWFFFRCHPYHLIEAQN
ncbi:hypothetical protein AVEN_237584-1 [Araneus ventricosus]|uniref:Uncharacterized protein n=1 Tax=Araneus ventricosus TaxID=182803 RepID=A0A4Y2QQT4_ARAVE|nr:hypothetical protein AVEN_237584-1 [Araneus ventricosus]